MEKGVNCEKCGYRIYPNEVLIMLSITRKDDNIYLHMACFTESLAKRLTEDILQYHNVIAILHSGQYK